MKFWKWSANLPTRRSAFFDHLPNSRRSLGRSIAHAHWPIECGLIDIDKLKSKKLWSFCEIVTGFEQVEVGAEYAETEVEETGDAADKTIEESRTDGAGASALEVNESGEIEAVIEFNSLKVAKCCVVTDDDADDEHSVDLIDCVDLGINKEYADDVDLGFESKLVCKDKVSLCVMTVGNRCAGASFAPESIDGRIAIERFDGKLWRAALKAEAVVDDDNDEANDDETEEVSAIELERIVVANVNAEPEVVEDRVEGWVVVQAPEVTSTQLAILAMHTPAELLPRFMRQTLKKSEKSKSFKLRRADRVHNDKRWNRKRKQVCLKEWERTLVDKWFGRTATIAVE